RRPYHAAAAAAFQVRLTARCNLPGGCGEWAESGPAAAASGGRSMNALHWRPVGRVDLARLREARMQAYYAAQWLARTARAYVPPQPDDGHTNLGWDNGLDGFTTHPFADGRQLGLRLPDLTLALLENGKIAQSFPLHGHSEAEARAWLGEQMQRLKLSPEALDTPLPYELSPHPLAEGGRYDAAA